MVYLAIKHDTLRHTIVVRTCADNLRWKRGIEAGKEFQFAALTSNVEIGDEGVQIATIDIVLMYVEL